jgi:hypothetical protein
MADDLIETACHNAIRAMFNEGDRATREQRSPEACSILAAALNELLTNGIENRDHLRNCYDHLIQQAAPRRAREAHRV